MPTFHNLISSSSRGMLSDVFLKSKYMYMMSVVVWDLELLEISSKVARSGWRQDQPGMKPNCSIREMEGRI